MRQAWQITACTRKSFSFEANDEHGVIVARTFGEDLAPGIDHERVPVVEEARLGATPLVGREHEALIFDGSGAHETFPMGLAGGPGEGGTVRLEPEATGGQRGRGGGGWRWAQYFVNVELPNAGTVTVSSSGAPFGRNGRALEVYLRDRGKEIIRDWFQDYQPEDSQGDDYVG